MAYATLSGATVGSYDENPGNARRRAAPEKRDRSRSMGQAALLKRRLRFDAIPTLDVDPVRWGILRLSYVDGFKAPAIAKRFNLSPGNVRLIICSDEKSSSGARIRPTQVAPCNTFGRPRPYV